MKQPKISAHRIPFPISFQQILFLLFFIFGAALYAQRSQPDTLHAVFTHDPITVDGILNEPAWQTAPKIHNFTQRELEEGAPPTERTEVAVLYDPENLYIGVWCYDSHPELLIANKMNRDFRWGGEDNFEIIIDTYNDHRNAYLFVTNPNGARADAFILDNGQQFNRNWDGVWTVKTSVTSHGWFAEFQIPFSTLKFTQSQEQVWGINFERNIRRKREQLMWQGWSRDSELEQISRAGKLVGLKGLTGVNLIELKPYLLGGVQRESDNNSNVFDFGGELNYLITPTLKMNLTVNTDFAQVESDRARINLSRFSLYYPEKRGFFLEGANYFNFGLGRRIQPFYSRKIGLAPDRTEIPIIAGARMLGKIQNATLGAMTIQTAGKDTIPTANYSVLRWQQDIGEQSRIGLIGVGKFEAQRQNGVGGMDFLYSTSHFMGDKILTVGGAYAHSLTSDSADGSGNAQRLFLSYPSDFVEIDASWERSSASFNPEVGFLRRTNYQMYYAEIQFNPRPAFLPFVRRLIFKPVDFNYFIDDATKEMTSLYTEFRPLGISFKSGDFVEFNIQRNAERLNEDFEIHDGFTILPGEYWNTRYEFQYFTFSGRPVFSYGAVSWGEFYDGTRQEYEGRIIWRVAKYFSVSYDFTRNVIDLPAGNFITNEQGGRIEWAVNPDLFGAFVTQWNSEDQEALINFRLNWIPKPGTDLYFVVNQTYDTSGNRLKITNTAVLSKLIWRFVL